ncbi:MAG: hypothetical protein PHU77_00065 [Simplicispira sp.]|nr:hypothetical protein [Simplicispira sp.]
MADISGPSAIVADKYAKSTSFADQAMSQVANFQAALGASIYSPPTINAQWSTQAGPALPAIPDLPDLPDVEFDEPTDQPSDLTNDLKDVQIDDFDVSPPEMNFGQAPTLTVGQVPQLPEMRDVEVPDAPEVEMPEIPQFLEISTHNFNGIDLHEGWLSKLSTIPELSILQPAPFQYSPGARYASQLLDSLKANLNARIHGGTGLAPAVEQAIWSRARDRETQIALAREQDVLRGAEALGFPLPSGVLAGQLADARREYHDKLSGLSRDIAIKQAELEQQNVKDAVQSALQLESSLLDGAYKIEMLAFEAAKAAAENAVTAYNAALEHYKTLVEGYRVYASVYESVMKGELAKVEAFKALLQAEETKANINKSLVERYKAEIEGRMARVEIFKAQVGAAKTLVELEQARIQAGGEQIRAFVATVSAETAKADLYKSQVQAESAKQEAYGAQVRAYGAKVGAQAEKARVEVAKFQAHVSAKAMEWDGWKAKVSAAVAKMDAAARQASITVDGYRLGASAAEAQAGAVMRQWEANIKQYEAGQNIILQTAKVNSDATIHANDARMEAAKVGLATASQQLAGAWAAVSASASISGGVTETHEYKHST